MISSLFFYITMYKMTSHLTKMGHKYDSTATTKWMSLNNDLVNKWMKTILLKIIDWDPQKKMES